jgi:CRP/FNR family transcriptional regulator, cyclic AMP receptor protein
MTQPDTSGMAELLSRIEFFEGCTQREIDDIANLVVDRHFAAGETLCCQGDAETHAFALIEGEASVIADGEPVGTAKPGDVIGELSMLGTGRRTATVTAITPVHVLVIDPREIDSVLAADPSSSQRLGRRDPSR